MWCGSRRGRRVLRVAEVQCVGRLRAGRGVPVPANVGVAGFSTTRSVTYAGFWLRFVAHLIDGLILGVGVFALVIPLLFLNGVGGDA